MSFVCMAYFERKKFKLKQKFTGYFLLLIDYVFSANPKIKCAKTPILYFFLPS